MANPGPESYPPQFLRAVDRLLALEGGYVNDPADPGGETKFGIASRFHPELDISNLTRDAAIEIYFRDWWQKFSYSDFPEPIAAMMLTIAPLIGPANAAVCLQRACRANHHPVGETGFLGPRTRDACHTLAAQNCDALLAAFRSEVAGWFRAKAAARGGDHSSFLTGWLNRAYA
ncbi:MAG TPA: glycosyl hydrolase 108 family protein [Candidatus Binataceae bacterium]|nr:glycosyl hydrolase 108 family protein [Candidatus Binataceae bacterium]